MGWYWVVIYFNCLYVGNDFVKSIRVSEILLYKIVKYVFLKYIYMYYKDVFKYGILYKFKCEYVKILVR